MYNRLYLKQFGFQTGISTEHATVKLADQIYESFEKDNYTLDVFIDLSKAFDTVDHTILIKKLEIYGIKGVNLARFRNYLTNRIQYISITRNLEADTKKSVAGLLKTQYWDHCCSCMLYVNDLHNSTALDPIMFADDTNLFYEHNDLNLCFR